MKGALMFLIGAIVGILIWMNLPGRGGKGLLPANATLQVNSAKDTVVINSKGYDTLVIHVEKDTIVIHSILSEYCKQVPKPPGCPPVIDKKMQTK